MFSHLSKLFHNDDGRDTAATEESLRLATCVLLLEVAHADDDFRPEEQEALEGIVARRFGLDPAATARLLAEAEQERQGAGDLYVFARQVNTHYPKARKLAILELLWDVVYSDGVLEAHEDALMHKLGNLLSIRHEDLMALKVRVRRRRGLS
ncbi:hypothetical protein CSB20_14915 [bacterium DOLZORAL124_64_63]|nr:MAG: hypothetical protein CSB20_14915 [bacterium DOLZORAL124_64_63]